MIAPNTILQSRYQIIRQIGQGGMGAVYMARDQRLRSVVALKESFCSDERMRRAFEREAELLANLHHPALPNVIDHFAEDDVQFLVMQFIPGEDLGAMMEIKGGPFSTEEVTAWADQLLDALDYLHTQESPILHRDIKPQNLKLTGRGQIILLDFGLAKGTAGQMSSVGASRSVLGFTPNFAPLEQIQGAGTDARSDLYALAATLYYLMTDVAPPDALTRASSLVRGQLDPLKPASEVNSQIPARVAGVLYATMAQNPDARPQTAALMREALRSASHEARVASHESALPPTEIAPARDVVSEPPAPQESQPVPPPTERVSDSFSERESHQVSPTVASQQTSAPAPKITYPQSPARGTLEKRRGRRLWLILGAAFVAVVIMIIAVSAGLFSGEKGTTSSKTGNVGASNTGGANNTSNTGEGAKTAPKPGAVVRNQMGMEFVYVPAVIFMMGSDKRDNEKPVHQVTIREGFFVGKYEVTQVQWQQLMGSNPSNFKNCDQCPVEEVSWNDAQEFVGKLNAMNNGYVYRLPTEAEWEYACRAGTTGDYAGSLDAMVWYRENSGSKTHSVGQKQPNAFGLYDMHGNVWEWCEDVWHENYNGALNDGSAWLSGGDPSLRVLRGGSWGNSTNKVRSAVRAGSTPDTRDYDVGFRLVAVART